MKIRIVTEKPGWIMHRQAQEIQKHLADVRINEPFPDADIVYYINYGYYKSRDAKALHVGCFTHYDPDALAEQFKRAAFELDHCIAISNFTANQLCDLGVPREKISVVVIGADTSFRPKLTLGIVGRTYKGGRKGEDLVHSLLEDEELMEDLQIVSTGEGWGVPLRELPLPQFYQSIDFLLVPARIEGGPVPFMEALACGTMSIAPPIGVIPDFPHIEYPTGDLDGLKQRIRGVKEEFLSRKRELSRFMEDYTWENWALEHKKIFENLLKDPPVRAVQ